VERISAITKDQPSPPKCAKERLRYPAHGDVIIVRYADDFVLGFQYHEEAERFLIMLQERFAKFGLSLHPGKTRLIEFGRYAPEHRSRRGQGKPETFDFLGFTHICARPQRGGFIVKRKTASKRLRAKLKAVKSVLLRTRHRPVQETGAWLRAVVQGYFNYHAIPGNGSSLDTFQTQVRRAWLRGLRRRSQRSRLTWNRFQRFAIFWIPQPRILHPYPNVCFDAKHPR